MASTITAAAATDYGVRRRSRRFGRRVPAYTLRAPCSANPASRARNSARPGSSRTLAVRSVAPSRGGRCPAHRGGHGMAWAEHSRSCANCPLRHKMLRVSDGFPASSAAVSAEHRAPMSLPPVPGRFTPAGSCLTAVTGLLDTPPQSRRGASRQRWVPDGGGWPGAGSIAAPRRRRCATPPERNLLSLHHLTKPAEKN